MGQPPRATQRPAVAGVARPTTVHSAHDLPWEASNPGQVGSSPLQPHSKVAGSPPGLNQPATPLTADRAQECHHTIRSPLAPGPQGKLTRHSSPPLKALWGAQSVIHSPHAGSAPVQMGAGSTILRPPALTHEARPGTAPAVQAARQAPAHQQHRRGRGPMRPPIRPQGGENRTPPSLRSPQRQRLCPSSPPASRERLCAERPLPQQAAPIQRPALGSPGEPAAAGHSETRVVNVPSGSPIHKGPHGTI
ncbi:hypothetical protein NDU88_004202 [Pleurodeles waltl]|uniref:Uncharacterized protein n=1 Tax=Pleurodeles waltl TaxID=8319 RepID=A0AAV7MWJ0_PLEWA|nr:hypothetical protein NDU88_004202 [Pleurodeles waltl]